MRAADIADLAAACQAVGTGAVSAVRIRELAGAEDGLRLDALEADAAALAGAAAIAGEALETARAVGGFLAQAWRSATGSAASEFLRRQCASGGVVVEQLAAAADTLRRLREDIAQQVQTRETATASIGARIGEPALWLAAARAVSSGRAGPDAVGIVTGQIAPFLDTAVAGEWAPAVESATAGVTAAYRRATSALADREPVRFDTPTMPAPASAPPSAPASASPAQPASAPPPVGAPFSAPPIPSIPPLPDFGGPAAVLGGALLPLVTAIAAVLGGHSGSPGAEEPPPSRGATAPSGESEPTPQTPPATEPESEPEAKLEPETKTQPGPAEPVTAPSPAPLAAEAPESPPVPPKVEPQRTPCEIAADELPQVGG